MIDFSNPAAVNWTKNIIKDNMLKEANAIGWMCDFGEYTPMDVVPKNFNEDAYNYHNRYPLDWAKTTWDAVKEDGKLNETVYFMRAGQTMSPAVTRLFWMGDQLPTFDKYDGM